MTHVAATVGARDETTAAQVLRFQEVLERARSAGLLAGRDLWIHVANSACLLTDLDPLFDAVRPGIAVYGVSPDPAIEAPELRPVMSVRTRIVQVKEVATGARIGYSGTWEARRPSRIATLPVGYDDGVDWRLGNRGHVLLRGRRAPIVGGISMDYTTIDVTEVPVPRLGEPVTLIGSDGAERIRVEELAQEIGTIPYDVTCSIGKRVQRVYLGGTESPSAESA
jgi:alanine racemase